MKISANKYRTTITKPEIVTSGSFKTYYCEVELSEDFDTADVVKVVFKTSTAEIETDIVDGVATIPCFDKKGAVFIGVFGYSETSGTLTKTVSPMYDHFAVMDGCYTEDAETPSMPDVRSYQELIEDINKKTERMKVTVTKNGNTFTADKTFAQILSAYQSGILPYVYLEYEILIPHIQTYDYMALQCLAGNQFVFSSVMGGVNNSVTVMSVYISFEDEVTFYMSNLS